MLMQIYNQEVLDGISLAVQSRTSIAYCSPVLVSPSPAKATQLANNAINKIRAASNPNQIDLYYIKSILVSTGWNKNDDVFTPDQTWRARATPEDKQFNFMHNENDIIGHITGTNVLDRNGKDVDITSTNIPDEFDIMTEAVLYTSWTQPDNKQRMQNIINEIEQGKWFVSMECLFAGFDYSVVSADGKTKLVARNEESSFLTKHLRAYGGAGEYDGYKIGRSLRDISFSGKGLVSKPANPRSVILDTSHALSINEKYTTIPNVSKGDFNMSDTSLEQQLADLQKELALYEEAITTGKTALVTAHQEFEGKILSLEASLVERDLALTAAQVSLAALEEAIASKTKELSELVAVVNDFEKREKNRSRKEKLILAGFEDSEADDSLPLYDTLGDVSFDAIIAAFKKKMAKKDMTKKEFLQDEQKEKEANPKAAEASESELETEQGLFDQVKSAEATLVDASDVNDELEATRASVAEWLTNNVLSK